MSRQRADQIDAVLHPGRCRPGRDRAAAVAVNREAERLRGRFVGVRVVDEAERAGRGPRVALQVPAREHARRRVDVVFGVEAHAAREELHQLAAEVFLRLRLGVGVAVEPDEHGRVLRDGDEHLGQRAERALAKQFDLPFLSGRILRRFRRQRARGVGRLNRAGELRVARREVVVPEEGHLLLQRAVRVDHAEQPPLPGVVDEGVGRKRRVRRRRQDVARLPDLRIHIVGDELVVDDPINRGAVRQVAEDRQVVGARAKPRASQQMLDALISHSGPLVPAPAPNP